MMEKINRDIALWRESHKEEVDLDEVELEAEEEAAKEPVKVSF